MDVRQLRIATAVWLASASAFLVWFDIWAATAILHPTRDGSGNVIFQVQGVSNTVYPFTYVAVAASVLGIALCIYWYERASLGRWTAALLGLVVGNLASIGMIDVYEQGFVTILAYTPGWQGAGRYWLHQYWLASATGFAGTLGGVLVVFSVLPWSRRANWKTVTLLGAVYLVSVAIWYHLGYQSPNAGNPTVYAMNAISRGATQLMLVAAVLPVDALDWAWSHLPAPLRARLHRGEHREAGAPVARPEASASEGAR